MTDEQHDLCVALAALDTIANTLRTLDSMPQASRESGRAFVARFAARMLEESMRSKLARDFVAVMAAQRDTG